MGRYKKKETRDEYVTMRMSKEEKERIQSYAKLEGISISKYCRKKCLEPKKVKVDKEKLLCCFEAIWQELYSDIEDIYGRDMSLEEQLEEKMEEKMEEVWNNWL